MKHIHIESWASNIGYIVEKTEKEGSILYYWHRANTLKSNTAYSVEEVVNNILEEIRSSLEEK